MWKARSIRGNIVTTENEFAWLKCAHCGFDLRGQIEPRCPECGQPLNEEQLRAGRADPTWRIFNRHVGLTAAGIGGCALVSFIARIVTREVEFGLQEHPLQPPPHWLHAAVILAVTWGPLLAGMAAAGYIIFRFRRKLIEADVLDVTGKTVIFGAFVVFTVLMLAVLTVMWTRLFG